MNEKEINEIYSYFVHYLSPIIFKYFTPIWIKPKDLPTNKPLLHDNVYIKDIPYGYDLAEDILKNGTYWFIVIECSKNYFLLREGLHRVYYLQQHQIGKERYLLAILKENAKDNKPLNETILLPKSLELHLDSFKIEQRLVDLGDYYILKVKTTEELYNVYLILCFALIPEMHNYQEFKSHDSINNPEKFKETFNLPILKMEYGKLVDEQGNKYSPAKFNMESYTKIT